MQLFGPYSLFLFQPTILLEICCIQSANVGRSQF